MNVHRGIDKDSGLIHSVVTTASNVHDRIPAAELLLPENPAAGHGQEPLQGQRDYCAHEPYFWRAVCCLRQH